MFLFFVFCGGSRAHAHLSIGSEPDGWRRIHTAYPRFGWLHTGDSTLKLEMYRREWLDYFGPVLKHVAVFVAPHHGSGHNFHPDLIAASASPLALTCASQKNPYGHPAPVIQRSAKAAGIAYQQVSEQRESAVVGLYFG
jgi:beta-lactamase superfamily II metal-dependent hydrolase